MLKARQKLGKYRLERQLAQGGFGRVYRAFDTIEGVSVAIKVPRPELISKEVLEDFRKEVRVTVRLDHPNILNIKTADVIDGHFVIVYPLGEQSLADRLQRRVSSKKILEYFEQILGALAHAHDARIIHCDVKPENLILFPDDRLRLADFGIAKVAQRTLRWTGSGSIGHMAPEQALGKPSFRSDVFAAGLILYRMLSGKLPEWPFTWPLPGFDRIRRTCSPEMIAFLKRALEVDSKRRFPDAGQMLSAFRKIRSRALTPNATARQRARNGTTSTTPGKDWKQIKHRQFKREFGKALELRHACTACDGPVSEAMTTCPWCGVQRAVIRDQTTFPARCARCRRGMKLDWSYCPWCYGPAYEPLSTREFTDRRYESRCASRSCSRKSLMPWMRYCPWCHHKVRRPWRLEGCPHTCSGCGWGIAGDYWSYCPWCGRGRGPT